mmetsp:Transcript_6973/g.18055  ORF Transcript_6973/g.18055 Transcript_6973/m.18055 type:complete len:80 (+) Transcript_6973:143-382(+)
MDFFSSLLSDDNSGQPDSTSFGVTGGGDSASAPRNQKHLGDAANKNSNSNSNSYSQHPRDVSDSAAPTQNHHHLSHQRR